MIHQAPAELTQLDAKELRARIADHEHAIAQALAPLDPITATMSWFDTLRAIEECINLVTVDWDDHEQALLFGLPVTSILGDAMHFRSVRSLLAGRFSENFAVRFTNLVIQGASMALAFARHGQHEIAAGFATVATMIGYLQSRRRHFVAMLHALPALCRGTQKVTHVETSPSSCRRSRSTACPS